ncbi:MAG TPA: hypothetical protein V6C81_17675 [Planktothrix sp.]|jgi:Flp pilus assembly pilin Flp
MKPKFLLAERLRKRGKRRPLGQGITEYAFVIAFVAIMVALTFSFTKGALMCAVSAAFSAMAGNTNNLAASGGSAS